MNVPVAQAQRVLTIRDTNGQVISAPAEIWVGALLQTLPPEWRDDVCGYVVKYLSVPKNQPKRIITP